LATTGYDLNCKEKQMSTSTLEILSINLANWKQLLTNKLCPLAHKSRDTLTVCTPQSLTQVRLTVCPLGNLCSNMKCALSLHCRLHNCS